MSAVELSAGDRDYLARIAQRTAERARRRADRMHRYPDQTAEAYAAAVRRAERNYTYSAEVAKKVRPWLRAAGQEAA